MVKYVQKLVADLGNMENDIFEEDGGGGGEGDGHDDEDGGGGGEWGGHDDYGDQESVDEWDGHDEEDGDQEGSGAGERVGRDEEDRMCVHCSPDPGSGGEDGDQDGGGVDEGVGRDEESRQGDDVFFMGPVDEDGYQEQGVGAAERFGHDEEGGGAEGRDEEGGGGECSSPSVEEISSEASETVADEDPYLWAGGAPSEADDASESQPGADAAAGGGGPPPGAGGGGGSASAAGGGSASAAAGVAAGAVAHAGGLNQLCNGRCKPFCPFLTLGLWSNTTTTEIKKTWLRLCLAHHPDKGGIQQAFVAITKSKDMLLENLQVWVWRHEQR